MSKLCIGCKGQRRKCWLLNARKTCSHSKCQQPFNFRDAAGGSMCSPEIGLQREHRAARSHMLPETSVFS